MEEEENPGNCNGFVNQVTVSEVFNKPEKKMLFVLTLEMSGSLQWNI